MHSRTVNRLTDSKPDVAAYELFVLLRHRMHYPGSTKRHTIDGVVWDTAQWDLWS